MVSVPGVNRWRHTGVMHGIGALGHVQLAKHDRAGLEQFSDHGAIGLRNVVCVDRHAGRGDHALGIAQVLDADRNAMHRPAKITAHEIGFCLARLLECDLAGHRQITSQ